MGWLSQASRDAIMANLTSIETAYQAVKQPIMSLFPTQPEDHIRFAVCALISFDLKPYANSETFTLKELIQEDGLDCDNYVALAWQFFDIMRPQSEAEVLIVGWEGGPIGNHAQMQIKTPGQPSMYCDPTIGLLVGNLDFDKLCMGIVPAASETYSIHSHNPRTEISTLNTNVSAAIMAGTYRASHLLYVCNSLAKLATVRRATLGTYPTRNG